MGSTAVMLMPDVDARDANLNTKKKKNPSFLCVNSGVHIVGTSLATPSYKKSPHYCPEQILTKPTPTSCYATEAKANFQR